MDCGIFLTRAEGWCLPLLQSMACSKPVITTNYSGHTEYCNSENSHLIDIDELEPAVDNLWFTDPQFNWASIGNKQIDQCIEYMQNIFKNRSRSNEAGLKTAQSLTWENTANKLISSLT